MKLLSEWENKVSQLPNCTDDEPMIFFNNNYLGIMTLDFCIDLKFFKYMIILISLETC